MLPQQSAKDVRLFTNQMLNALERLVPPAPLELDNWCHIGMTSFVSGERRGRIMDEADMALRSAQLQGSNNWFAFKKEQQTEDARGSVRWRTLLDAVLDADAIQLHQQPVINASDGHILQRELLARIRDENGLQIKASRFLPAVEQVGFTIRMDKQVVSQALATLKLMPSSEVFSVNLNVASLLERSFVRWLRDELLQTPRTVLNRLSFEVTEGALVKHLDAMRPIARMMIGLGCKLVVDQAGRTIVSTHYIKDLNIDYIKLHRSLVREINLRQENQLFVRSMLGACGDSRAKVIAVGVENEKEWDVLKSLGVYAGQGRYFSPEMSLEKHLIADRKETSSVFHNNTKK